MTSTELVKIISKITELLALYPDAEISKVIDDLIRLKYNDSPLVVGGKSRSTAIVDNSILKNEIDKLVDATGRLSIPEIADILSSEELFPSMDFIRYFARRIGIEVSPRQSRRTAIHTILRYIDRMRIQETISKRNSL